MQQDLPKRTLAVLNNITKCERELGFKHSKIEECNANIYALSRRKDIIVSAKEYHKKAVDLLYASSIKELEDLINDVMSAIFKDRNLKVHMELSDSRSKSLSWRITDYDRDIEYSVQDGSGRGIRTVLSFILQSYYLLSFGSKFMFIDEGYSYISEEYVKEFFEFVKLLCKEKGLALVMISHDDRFTGYADSHYHIIAGTIADKNVGRS